MLFDLRGRGRRRTVQGIYLGLAILMGGGLIFFGVGGSGVGLFGNDNGGSSTANTKALKQKAEAAQKYAQAHPHQAGAFDSLARARYQQAPRDTNGVFTQDAVESLHQAAAAWQRYLKLNPGKIDSGLARFMAAVYGPGASDIPQNLQNSLSPTGGLNNPAEAARALEYVTGSDPSALGYYQLAVFATLAGQTRKATLAGEKAVQLAAPGQRRLYRAQLALAGVTLPKVQAKKAATKAKAKQKSKAKAKKKKGSGQNGSGNGSG